MRTVGHRAASGDGIVDQKPLARTAAALRGTPFLVPRGVYRFDTFEEAETWLNETIRRTHERLSRPTSPASVAP